MLITALLTCHFWITVRRMLLAPLTFSANFELVITLAIIPFVVNSIIFWSIDSFTTPSSYHQFDIDKNDGDTIVVEKKEEHPHLVAQFIKTATSMTTIIF